MYVYFVHTILDVWNGKKKQLNIDNSVKQNLFKL